VEIIPENILILMSGIILGFLIASVKNIITTRAHNTEIKKIEDYMNAHLKLTREKNKEKEEELKKLKKHNEDLKISVKTLGQKVLNLYLTSLDR